MSTRRTVQFEQRFRNQNSRNYRTTPIKKKLIGVYSKAWGFKALFIEKVSNIDIYCLDKDIGIKFHWDEANSKKVVVESKNVRIQNLEGE